MRPRNARRLACASCALHAVRALGLPAQHLMEPGEPVFSLAGPMGDRSPVFSSNAGPMQGILSTQARAVEGSEDAHSQATLRRRAAATATRGVAPLKGYGDRKYAGPFRVYSTALNCEDYTYAFGCGSQSRGLAGQCLWCYGVDVCVQGDPTTGPDDVGKRQLAAKSIRCDTWQVAA